MQDRRFFTSMAAALFLMAGFTSCTNDELEQKPLDGRTPINLTSSVATRSISQNIQDTQIANGVQVGVFAKTDAGAIDNGDNNVLTADGTGGFTGGNTMYFPEEDDVSIYAYAPYNSNWAGMLSTDNEFTVQTDQSSDANYCASDLMIGVPSTNPVPSTTDAVQLNFKHKLTKLNINFNVGTSGINLQEATVKVINVNTAATVNIETGTVAQSASPAPADITAAVFAADASTFTASVIFVPQTINAGTTFVQVTTSDASEFTAPLSQNVTFEGGKKYTYTAQFTGGGDPEEPAKMELKVGSVVDNWEDALLDQYAIGDYITKDGQILKEGELSSLGDADAIKSAVVAVIFSKEVSDKDNAAGYNAYAMSLDIVGSKKWAQSNILYNTDKDISDYAVAKADLDGIENTNDVLENPDYFAGITDNEQAKMGYAFQFCERETSQNVIPNLSSSGWFVPSFGQMIQIIENLGGVTINESEIKNNSNNPMYYVNDSDIVKEINKYATAAGRTSLMSTGTTYITSTECGADKFWCLQTTPSVTENDTQVTYNWGFGKNAGKTGSNRVLIPCVAVTLPAASLY